MHPLTLTLADRTLERAFTSSYQRAAVRHVRVSLVVAAFLYAVFGVLDGSIIPEAASTARLMRYAVVCPLALGLAALSYWRGFARVMAALVSVFALVAGGGIIVMIVRASPPGSYLYYAGLILACSYIYTFVKLRFVLATPIAWAIVIAYELATWWADPATPAILLNNAFFLAGINIIGMSACYAMERSTRADFLDKRTIAERTASLDAALTAAEAARRHAEELARRDPLTGLFNRRHFFEVAERQHGRGRDAGRPLAVAMIDIDHFKRINDRHGHALGDRVLLAVAEMVQASVRPDDVVARYGGEEFLVLLPGALASEASRIGERLRRAIERMVIPLDGSWIPVTVSVGVAACSPHGREGIDDLIARADGALYVAKESGRNRLVLAGA